jgi:hypothetical protein
MTEPLTYEDFLRQIDAEHAHALDEAHSFLAGLGNEQIYAKLMQQAYRELDAARDRAIEKLNRIWGKDRCALTVH